MTRNESMALAEQAGIEFQSHVGVLGRTNVTTHGSQSIKKIQRLIELAVAKEREACASLCDRFAARITEAQQGPSDALSNMMLRQVAVLGFGEAAAAIRARGQKEGA